jgi:hypothetical protein
MPNSEKLFSLASIVRSADASLDCTLFTGHAKGGRIGTSSPKGIPPEHQRARAHA